MFQQAGDGGGDLGLPGVGSAAPAAQPEAVGDAGRLAEADHELVAQQGAFGGGERGRGQGHGDALPCPLRPPKPAWAQARGSVAVSRRRPGRGGSRGAGDQRLGCPGRYVIAHSVSGTGCYRTLC